MNIDTKMLESALNNKVNPFVDIVKTETKGKISVTVFNLEVESVEEMRGRGFTREQNGVHKIVETVSRISIIQYDVAEIDTVGKFPEMNPSL